MRGRARLLRASLAVVLSAGWLLLPVATQSQAASKRTILGQVLDENEKVVATAVVHLINLATKKQMSAVTDKEGRYQFNAVDPKVDLQLYAERGEQKSHIRTVSQFDARTRIVIDLKLEPAKQPEEKKEKDKPN